MLRTSTTFYGLYRVRSCQYRCLCKILSNYSSWFWGYGQFSQTDLGQFSQPDLRRTNSDYMAYSESRPFSTGCANKNVNRRDQGLPHSQIAANPRHQEKEKKDKKIYADKSDLTIIRIWQPHTLNDWSKTLLTNFVIISINEKKNVIVVNMCCFHIKIALL